MISTSFPLCISMDVHLSLVRDLEVGLKQSSIAIHQVPSRVLFGRIMRGAASLSAIPPFRGQALEAAPGVDVLNEP